MNALRAVLIVAVSIALLGGCASSSKHMTETTVASGPAPGKALVVFMRPSGFAFAIDASVFRLNGSSQEILGISSARTRIDYQATPGKHMFMVVSEAADFLDANLEAGKTYYVIVEPRMGAWKARFSLSPVRKGPPSEFHRQMKQWQEWLAAVKPVTSGPSVATWYSSNVGSIDEKRTEYLPKWKAKPAEDLANATLNAADGE